MDYTPDLVSRTLDLYTSLEDKGVITSDFARVAEEYTVAKSVFFYGGEPNAFGFTAGELQEKYRIMSSFDSFAAFKNWYVSFFAERAEEELRRLASGWSRDERRDIEAKIGYFRQELSALGGEDLTRFPLAEDDLGKMCKTTMEGGALRLVRCYLPPVYSFAVVAKKMMSKRSVQEEELQSHLAGLLSEHQVVGASVVDSVRKISTYPQYGGTLSDIVMRPDEEKKELVGEVLRMNGKVSLDMQDYLAGKNSIRGKEDVVRALGSYVDENTLTEQKLREIMFTHFVVRSHLAKVEVVDLSDAQHVADVEHRLREDVQVQRLLDGYTNLVARQITALPYFPIHGDLSVYNVLRERDMPARIRLHDFSFYRGPLQYDVVDLLDSAGMEEKTKDTLVREYARFLRGELHRRGMREKLDYFDTDTFYEGYKLLKADRALKKAPQLWRRT